MANQSEPLLLSADDSDIDHKTRPEELTFDNIVERSLSDFGFWQLFQVLLVGLALFFDAQQIFITVYTDAYPTWHCVNHTICDHSTSDICKLPRSAWEWDGGSTDKTVISDFGLECSSSLLRSMPSSAFYIGAIVGGFFLAFIPDDSLGRKKLVLFSNFAMSITSISVVFSTNVWIYITLKFIIGFSRSQTWSYALVLISERVSTKWRPRATMIPFTFFVSGFMSLSGIAYLAQHSSWRYLYLYTAVPAIFYCIFLYLFRLESPRWLHLQGNDEEAIHVPLLMYDSLGRKKLVLFSNFAMSITSISVVFSTNVWIYITLKFIIGFSRSQTWSYALVLISERVSTKWRPRATMIPFTFFVSGFMSLSGIAYLAQHSSWRYLYLYTAVPQYSIVSSSTFSLQGLCHCPNRYLAQHSSWRYLYLYTAVPAIFYCIFLYLFALESPRWLHLQGNDEEAIHVLKCLSSKNKAYLESLVSQLPVEQETSEELPRYSIKDFFFRKWAFRRIVVVMIILFGLGISYYGVPLAARDIDVNIYLSETLNAVVELPTFIITPIILERFSRRSSVLVNTLLGGASGVLCFLLSVFRKTGIAFAFELGTFFCARTGFNLMAVYMVEMFPTCVRSSAIMMFRQALVVGGACCPLIASIGRDLPSVSFAVFGVAMSGLGLFVLILPETKGSSLCDTMEEQEKRDQAINTSHC
ncbi:hypothetical protein Bca52824_006617 [Brassica carinata]|uniref:Major facilitator superfamily (MFS) profile domain-containing protein n=1 Tax=Brassica carinata TaxID=52824 RepID=A0A8X8B4N3_BRACI|nr:hypothetical protein Bca52824_006617 [Brassica carinata]